MIERMCERERERERGGGKSPFSPFFWEKEGRDGFFLAKSDFFLKKIFFFLDVKLLCRWRSLELNNRV